MSEPARTYNQTHVPRPYAKGRRRVSVYIAWSYPAEANRNVAEMDNRFSTMTEDAAYFLPILTRAFLRPANGPVKEAPLPMVIALTLTAVGTVLLFLFPGVPFRLASMIVGG